MHGYYTNYYAEVPDITVYINCDTRLAINLAAFDLSEFDEFIFTIKNYDYIDSSYAFLFRARKSDIDKNGEVILNIDPDTSKNIKPGAFYNFALLVNAFNTNEPTEYKKLTENGKINLKYGAHDLALESETEPPTTVKEVLGVQLERVDDALCDNSKILGIITDVKLEDFESEGVC